MCAGRAHTVHMATTTDTTTCTGNVLRMDTLRNVATDSQPGRYVDVTITRCTGCPGTAYVVHDDGMGTVRSWAGLQLPMEYRADDAWAAYWAAEASSYMAPTHVVEPELQVVPDWDEGLDMGYPVEDEDEDQAYARMLERRAEQGTWWGQDTDW